MLKSNYLLYKTYLKNRRIDGQNILISKTKNSILIGPIINEKFDENSFYKRIKSNSIYKINIYKNISRKKATKIIEQYSNKIGNNEVIEVFKNKEFIIHKIVAVPGGEICKRTN